MQGKWTRMTDSPPFDKPLARQDTARVDAGSAVPVVRQDLFALHRLDAVEQYVERHRDEHLEQHDKQPLEAQPVVAR